MRGLSTPRAEQVTGLAGADVAIQMRDEERFSTPELVLMVTGVLAALVLLALAVGLAIRFVAKLW